VAEREGFTFHYMDGELYWDESACYAFTMEEVERDLEEPTRSCTPCASIWSPRR
jgi:glutathionylspermidine synthase